LAARLLNGYQPAVGRTFQVMTYGVVAGTFTDYSGLDVGSSRAFTPVYTSTSLSLVAYATNSPVYGTPIVLSNPRASLKQFSFLFTGDIGKTYVVQYRNDFLHTNWTTLLVTNIPVSPVLVTDTNPAAISRFYRVIATNTAIVRLTPIVLSKPVRSASQFTFLFTGDTGANYTVQYRTNIAQTDWIQLLITNLSVSPARVTDFGPLGPTRLYRVIAGP